MLILAVGKVVAVFGHGAEHGVELCALLRREWGQNLVHCAADARFESSHQMPADDTPLGAKPR